MAGFGAGCTSSFVGAIDFQDSVGDTATATAAAEEEAVGNRLCFWAQIFGFTSDEILDGLVARGTGELVVVSAGNSSALASRREGSSGSKAVFGLANDQSVLKMADGASKLIRFSSLFEDRVKFPVAATTGSRSIRASLGWDLASDSAPLAADASGDLVVASNLP